MQFNSFWVYVLHDLSHNAQHFEACLCFIHLGTVCFHFRSSEGKKFWRKKNHNGKINRFPVIFTKLNLSELTHKLSQQFQPTAECVKKYGVLKRRAPLHDDVLGFKMLCAQYCTSPSDAVHLSLVRIFITNFLIHICFNFEEHAWTNERNPNRKILLSSWRYWNKWCN